VARKLRETAAGLPLHIIHRGNNRMVCFLDDQDRGCYLNWMNLYRQKYNVSVHAWVLMSNHIHMLCTPHEKYAASQMMKCLAARYVRYFNSKYARTGTLWEGRFKSFPVFCDVYLLTLYRYIELNPVRAHLVSTPREYHWSSYKTNAYGRSSNLITPHSTYLELGKSEKVRQKKYKDLIKESVNQESLRKIGLNPKELGIELRLGSEEKIL